MSTVPPSATLAIKRAHVYQGPLGPRVAIRYEDDTEHDVPVEFESPRHPTAPVNAVGTLLPCPFCGSAAVFSRSTDGDIVNVRCEQWSPGKCLGAGANCYTEAEAAAAWNRRATPSSTVPTGWKLVPIEPTDAMLEAQFGKAGPRECYRAMVDAAPSARCGHDSSTVPMEAALRRLMKESAAVVALAEQQIRDACGHTNFACFQHAINEAGAVLGVWQSERSASGTSEIDLHRLMDDVRSTGHVLSNTKILENWRKWRK